MVWKLNCHLFHQDMQPQTGCPAGKQILHLSSARGSFLCSPAQSTDDALSFLQCPDGQRSECCGPQEVAGLIALARLFFAVKISKISVFLSGRKIALCPHHSVTTASTSDFKALRKKICFIEIRGEARFRFIKGLAVWLYLQNPFLINNSPGFFREQ